MSQSVCIKINNRVCIASATMVTLRLRLLRPRFDFTSYESIESFFRRNSRVEIRLGLCEVIVVGRGYLRFKRNLGLYCSFDLRWVCCKFFYMQVKQSIYTWKQRKYVFKFTRNFIHVRFYYQRFQSMDTRTVIKILKYHDTQTLQLLIRQKTIPLFSRNHADNR